MIGLRSDAETIRYLQRRCDFLAHQLQKAYRGMESDLRVIDSWDLASSTRGREPMKQCRALVTAYGDGRLWK